MALIKRREKTERTNIGLRIDETLIARLKQYADYTNVPMAEIVETAIRHVISSDADFKLAIAHNPAGEVLTNERPKSQQRQLNNAVLPED
jgi:predicted DNA-binding protein